VTQARRMGLEYRVLDDLLRWPRNPKDHDLDQLSKSFERFGYTDPILVDETSGRIVAGHGRLETLQQKMAAGEERPDLIDVDDAGRWLVPVIRGVGFKDALEAEAYLVADNQLVIGPGWKNDELDAMLAEHVNAGRALEGTGIDAKALQKRLAKQSAELAAEAEKNLAGGDSSPREDAEVEDYGPIPEKPVTEPGDLWILGTHRILCGDSLKDEQVDRLLEGAKIDAVIEDPPYAIYGSSTGIGADIADDRMVRPFFEAVGRQAMRILPWFGHAYVCCDWRSWASLWDAARSVGLTCKNKLIWNKKSGLGSSYANVYEEIGFFHKLPPAKSTSFGTATGVRTVNGRSNLLTISRPKGDEKNHNASKPVDLIREFIRNSTDAGGKVFDGFAGGGSTLIACELEGRVCYTMDCEPKEVDKVVRRWEKVTGKRARRVRPGKGRTRRKAAPAAPA
jgi:DNA modification methylase